MKKIIFFGFLFLATICRGQTISEISRIMNSGPKPIVSNSASSLNADILPSFDLTNAGYKIISVDIAGTWSGTISFQGRSQTGIWYSIASYSPDNVGTFVLNTTSNGHFNIPTLGFDQIRIRMTSYASGTATSIVTGFFNNIFIPTPASAGGGGGGGGAVTQSGIWNLNNITGTVSLPTGAATESTLSSLIGKFGALGQTTMVGSAPVVIASNQSSIPVTGTFWQATQPVSLASAITANIGTSGSLALDATLTNRTQFAKITDGSNDATVKAASTAAIATDKALVVAISPNNTIPVSGTFWQATQPVSGTFWQATQPVSGTIAATQSGTWTVQPGNTANTTAWKVDGSAVTQPVSGTVSTNVNAGSNIIGKVGIDQTTNGTTNRVNIGTDGTVAANQSGTWNENSTLQTGTNYVGYINPDINPSSTSITVAGNGTSFAISGMQGVGLVITGSAVSFSFKAQVSMNSGTSWDDTYVTTVGGTSTLNATINGQYQILAPSGTTHVRVVLNSITSGTFTYKYTANMAGNPVNLSVSTPGFNTPPSTTIVGGVDGAGKLQTLSTSATGVLKTDASATTQPVSGTVTSNAGTGTFNIQSNASVSLGQIAGTTILTGNGVTGAGSQRVTIASDNTAFSVNNTQVGTASHNVAQINGITPLMGNGVTGTGSQRVTIASDNTAFAVNNTQQGTASQNVAQVNGITTLTGNGVTGTGSQRVTIASDNTAFAVNNTQQGTSSQNLAQISGNSILTGNGVTGTGSQRVTIASDNTAFSVNDVPPTLTKGTQGATGFSTQDLKDAGRVPIALTIEVAGAATSEALATVTESRSGGATATFTSKVITSGKKIRFQSVAMEVESLGSGTAPQRVWLRLRVNTAGATTASSPQQSVWSCVNNFAAAKSGTVAVYSVPDGLEFTGDGTATYGLTLTFPDWVTSTATVQVKITVIAFEY
jgi:hypothetical protein